MHYRATLANWRVLLFAVVAAIITALGLTLTTAAPAHANNSAFQRIVNDTPYTIGAQFRTNHNTDAWLFIGPYQWQGETYGNQNYEPRYIHLGAGYCITWYYWVWGANPGVSNVACGGSAGGWVYVYLGDGYNVNYDIHVKNVFAEYGP